MVGFSLDLDYPDDATGEIFPRCYFGYLLYKFLRLYYCYSVVAKSLKGLGSARIVFVSLEDKSFNPQAVAVVVISMATDLFRILIDCITNATSDVVFYVFVATSSCDDASII